MHLIVGTAGHIDHGKTALVKALTGIDADRLPEEKKRGITIDLGFAELEAGGVSIGFVDVPGHERFVKNMLAGACGIDLVLLVIAADEGVMPQTREHFEICRLLQIKSGIIALTKKDAVDDEMLELVRLDVAELVAKSFLQDAPMFAVSSKTGEGIDEMKAGLIDAARKIPARHNDSITRLPIDRSFTVKGFGSVVTGTLAAGEISESDEMELLPVGRRVRVRGLQTHGKSVHTAFAGQRTAVNLGGIDHTELTRGMVLSEPGVLIPTQIFDAEIEVLPGSRALKSRQRVRVHLGTAETLARLAILNETREIEPGRSGFAQFRLEVPIVAVPGDRFIVRSYSPQITIAGGQILTTPAKKHRRRDAGATSVFLRKLANAEHNANILEIIIKEAGGGGMSRADLRSQTCWRNDVLNAAIEENKSSGSILDADGVFLSQHTFDALKTKTVNEIGRHHKLEPLARGLLKETLRERVFKHLPAGTLRSVTVELERLGKVKVDKDVLRLASHSAELSGAEKQVFESLRSTYEAAKFEVPRLDDVLTDAAKLSGIDQLAARKIFQLLVNSGEIVQVNEEFYFSAKAIDTLISKVRESAADDRLIDVAKFKELAGISRKYAIPLLEYFDRQKVTLRTNDKRIIL
jgi:selenocysteine-specific elongation factor